MTQAVKTYGIGEGLIEVRSNGQGLDVDNEIPSQARM